MVLPCCECHLLPVFGNFLFEYVVLWFMPTTRSVNFSSFILLQLKNRRYMKYRDSRSIAIWKRSLNRLTCWQMRLLMAVGMQLYQWTMLIPLVTMTTPHLLPLASNRAKIQLNSRQMPAHRSRWRIVISVANGCQGEGFWHIADWFIRLACWNRHHPYSVSFVHGNFLNLHNYMCTWNAIWVSMHTGTVWYTVVFTLNTR